jgi:hypothetical protein
MSIAIEVSSHKKKKSKMESVSINRHRRQLHVMTRENDGGSAQAVLKVKIVYM